jgi:hypothetical protein
MSQNPGFALSLSNVSRRTSLRLLVAFTLVWGAWAVWAVAGGTAPVTVNVIDDVGVPVSGAQVSSGGVVLGVTADDGSATVEWHGGLSSFALQASGYATLQVAVLGRPDFSVEAVLRPNLLRGRIVDPEERPVEGAYVTAGAGTAVTDLDGRFSIRKAEQGPVQVWRPAWEGSTFDWNGNPGEEFVTIRPETMRAVHIGGEAAEKGWSVFVQMAADTELNALMLDLKDETGVVFYETASPTAHRVAAVYPRYDLAALIAEADEFGLYVIGRIVSFLDPIAAVHGPSMAVWDMTTGAPYNADGQYFLDPTDPAAQAYALELAVEACGAGVDEIQFDYVRFPDQRSQTARFDAGVSPDIRVNTVRDFLATAVAQLHPLGCAVAADIFGFVTRAVDDGGIGQQWEDLTAVVDVASPMLYPSHYASGWYGFERPNEHPAELVGKALDDGIERLARQIVLRPWLQDFGYTPEQVRAQIDEVNERGLGWMLWNAQSEVTVEALAPDE